MEHLFEYLIGGKKMGRAARYKFHPQTKKELQELLKELIKERGMDGDFNDIDTSQITDMPYLFDSTNFNGDISEWDVSNVKDMGYMFYGCKKFNCDITDWDVSNVKDMGCMFAHASSFNQDISKWDVHNVKDMSYMFDNCPIREKFKPKFNE